MDQCGEGVGIDSEGKVEEQRWRQRRERRQSIEEAEEVGDTQEKAGEASR